jgi:hypothetical protein
MQPTPTVEDFADAAREFIAWVEGEAGEPMDEARTAQKHLARLYHLATFLREVEPEDKEYKPLDTAKKGEQVYHHRFKDFPIGLFPLIFDPLAQPPESVGYADAVDGLRDIWSDIAKGLHQWDSGHRQEAEWMWQHRFNHWGQHIAELLYALHMYFWNRDISWET